MKRRALLIDPWKQIIKEIAVEGNLLEALYKILGCDCVEPHPFPDGSKNDIWIDESGFLLEPVPACIFLIGSRQPLPGRGVVLGRAGARPFPPVVLKRMCRVLFAGKSGNTE